MNHQEGDSITNENEHFSLFKVPSGRWGKRTVILYEYKTAFGTTFSFIADSVAEAMEKRDQWLNATKPKPEENEQ